MRALTKIVAIFLLLCNVGVFAQKDSLQLKKARKLTFYGTWGYNRWTYTRSTIHFKNEGDPNYTNPTHGPYDFTLYNVKAHDSPDFNQIASKWSDVINVSIPQFSIRFGFYFGNDKDEGWEINYDHAKYVVSDQTAHIKGTILGKAVDKDTFIYRPYLHFEHTDGANFWLLNYVKRWKLYASKHGKSNIGVVVKPGAGVVIPRTDVTIFGSRLNNRWHVAGFMAGVETGIRAEFWSNFCVEFTGKAVYTDYLWCFVQYKGNGNANHMFGGLGAILSFGYQFHHIRPLPKN